MMNEYKGLINKSIINSYNEALIIDIMDDKLYKYLIKNNDVIFNCELSYMDYLNDCKNFIHEDDVKDSLSLSKLEHMENAIRLSYRKKDSVTNVYCDYMNDISLCELNGKRMVVVLISIINDGKKYTTCSDEVEMHLETKLNNMVDSVSTAILKIHNIVNNGSNIYNKDEFINSILSSLTNEYPEFTEYLNDNAMYMNDMGKSTIMIIDDDKILKKNMM